ncbi:MAG: hypothetical protein B6242_02420 [Anaerolineaceae bacterium 4572_78]|nr:MAG: hypothetical protein B6242_02420 [Anaerolineaceae bacterium 4572_78]
MFNAKTKNMAWDIFRHDFQSHGRIMERNNLLFHVKTSFEQPYIPNSLLTKFTPHVVNCKYTLPCCDFGNRALCGIMGFRYKFCV